MPKCDKCGSSYQAGYLIQDALGRAVGVGDFVAFLKFTINNETTVKLFPQSYVVKSIEASLSPFYLNVTLDGVSVSDVRVFIPARENNRVDFILKIASNGEEL